MASSAYTRAERFTKIKSQTLPKVGPNTYDLPDAITGQREGYAPFNTTAPRSNERALRKIGALPSGASYFPRLQHNVTGGSSMWYTAPRFKYKAADEDGPAPGAYEIRTERETAVLREKRPKGVGKLYVCKVDYSVGASPPTIPYRNNANGYDIGPDGFLKAVEPSWHDLTLGPAFYEPQKSKDCTCERYRGCQWSNRTAKRDTMGLKDGPGPADYDVGIEKWDPAKCRDEAIRFSKRKYSNVPRYLDAVEQITKRQNYPGPGHYDPYKEEKKKKKKGKKPSYGFLCSAPRWKYSSNENPGPGEYEEVRRGLCPLKPGSIKDSAFLVDAPRFPRVKEEKRPGPANYSLPGMQEEAVRRLGSVYATVPPPFNNSAIRDLNFAPRDASSFPAPGEYNVEYHRCFCGPTAVFKSKTRRGPKETHDDYAHCGTYNIDKPYRAAFDQRSHRYPEEESFNATNERFGRVTDMKNRVADPRNPSAAEYNLADYRPYRSRNCGPIEQAKRFDDYDNHVPGPGTYSFHPSIRETCVIGTQNVTLGNPLPNRSTARPRLFISALGKKKLRWFARPPKDYIHCP